MAALRSYGQAGKFLATERRNLALHVNGEAPKTGAGGAIRPFTTPGFRAFRPKGIVLTRCPQAPATFAPNESLTACTRFANQINHFSNGNIHH
jgi:hypothetical protein